MQKSHTCNALYHIGHTVDFGTTLASMECQAGDEAVPGRALRRLLPKELCPES